MQRKDRARSAKDFSDASADSVRKQRANRIAASRKISNGLKRGSLTSNVVKRPVSSMSKKQSRQSSSGSKRSTRSIKSTKSTTVVDSKSKTKPRSDNEKDPSIPSSRENNMYPAVDAKGTTKPSSGGDAKEISGSKRVANMESGLFMVENDDHSQDKILEMKPSEISIVKSQDTDEISHPSRMPSGFSIVSPENSFSFDESPKQKFPNLHLDLAACAWEKLHQQLEFLSHNPAIAIPTLAVTYPEDGATPLHTASWKAPTALALMIIRLLPVTDAGNKSFVQMDDDGNTPLHLCCANIAPFYNSSTSKNSCPFIDLSVLELLLQRAPEALSIKNNQGDTPLHLFLGSPAACYSDDLSEESSLKALSMILDHLPSPHTALEKDETGATPLHVAVASEANKLIIAKLIEAAPEACEIEDEHGMVPIHYVAAFLKVPATVVAKMLEVYPLAVCHKTENGDTPLHLLVRNTADAQSKHRADMDINTYHMYESMKELDENTRDVVDLLLCVQSTEDKPKHEHERISHKNCALLIANVEKLTPLHCCALFNAPTKLTNHLMKHPHALRAASMQNAFGATALHLAVAQQSAGSFVDTALAVGTSEAAVVQDKLKRTPLHVAAQNIHATRQLIQGLVELNSVACTKKTERGHLPLHIAAQSQAKEPVIDALISAFPAGAEIKNKSNNTPLHDAAKYHALSGVVQLLLKQYPEAVYIQNQYGNLPLHCATAYQAPSLIVGLLLKAWPHGASIQNRNEDCPLHYAAAYAKSADVLKLLIDAAPASVLVLNKHGQSPIGKAKSNDAPEDIIEMLEKSGEDLTRKALEDGWGDFS